MDGLEGPKRTLGPVEPKVVPDGVLDKENYGFGSISSNCGYLMFWRVWEVQNGPWAQLSQKWSQMMFWIRKMRGLGASPPIVDI